MRSLLARLTPLHSENADYKRNVKLSKMGLFSIFLYTFTVNCVTTGAQKMPIVYMFRFICSKQCININSLRKKCGLYSSVFKKIVPYNNTPTFQEVGRVTLPLTFCR